MDIMSALVLKMEPRVENHQALVVHSVFLLFDMI